MCVPNNQAGIEDHGGNDDGQDQARDEAQCCVRIWETHNSKTDILGEEQRRSLHRRLALSFAYSRDHLQ